MKLVGWGNAGAVAVQPRPCDALIGLRSRKRNGRRDRQPCIPALVSLLALPAIWSGSEPAQIVRTLIDSLLNNLQRLNFVYLCSKTPVGELRKEIMEPAIDLVLSAATVYNFSRLF